jgi:hypothetical protein
MLPLPDHLELVPTTDTTGNCTQWEGNNRFSLSAPVLEASMQELLRDEFHENARKVLRKWIDIDMANLARLKDGIRSFQLPYEYKTNGEPYGGSVTQGITKAESLESSISQVKQLVAYLALGCCRFQRHRVRCMNETGGEPWSDESLRGSSSWRR